MTDNRRCESDSTLPELEAPALPYRPHTLKRPAPGIALVGCGGIAEYHLGAYQRAGYPVLALCDVDLARAEALRERFFPDAFTTADYQEAIGTAGVGVVDAATHPDVRGPIIEASLNAGKDVLSQKPFVTDLEAGTRLCDLADAQGCLLAVNQNGRWAPHFSYARHAIEAGTIGTLKAVTMAVNWDHNWTVDTPFNDYHDLILFDFGIHWFDMLHCFFGDREPVAIRATTTKSPGQRATPFMLATVVVTFDEGQGVMVFNGDTLQGTWDNTLVTGGKGTLICEGPDINHQTIRLYTESGVAFPKLEGDWFSTGFEGTMAELLHAREQGVQPRNSGRNILKSLAWCFAALESARTGEAVKPGAVTTRPEAW